MTTNLYTTHTLCTETQTLRQKWITNARALQHFIRCSRKDRDSREFSLAPSQSHTLSGKAANHCRVYLCYLLKPTFEKFNIFHSFKSLQFDLVCQFVFSSSLVFCRSRTVKRQSCKCCRIGAVENRKCKRFRFDSHNASDSRWQAIKWTDDRTECLSVSQDQKTRKI